MATAFGLLVAACDDMADAGRPAPRPIAWAEVEAAAPCETLTLSGVVRPVQEAPLSFEVSGLIATIEVDIGDHFAEGDLLATLDTRTWRLERDERSSELAEARAALVEALAHYERQARLHADGWVARAGFDDAAAARDTARSRVATAEARLAIAEMNLADTELEAPYAGVVAHRHAEPSQRVVVGEPVLDVQGNSGGFEVRVAVPETVVDRVVEGSVHRIALPARRGASLEARVKDIGAEADPGSAYEVTLALDPSNARLRSGMTAEVVFTLPALDVRFTASADAGPMVAIPITAFVAGDGDGHVAFVFDGTTRTVERRAIEVAAITNDRARIARGLQAGEIVAAKGVDFLSDGQAVTLLGSGPERYHP